MRVVVAEDNTLLRQGVKGLLEQAEIEVVADVGDAESLRQAVDANAPDLVVTDIRMPPNQATEGLDAARWLAQNHPGTGVVVLSQHVTPDYALRLLDEGPPNRAYLLKERVSDVSELISAIHTVYEGGSVIDPLVVDALVAASRKDDSPMAQLTPRELEVLSELATGKNNAAIADKLVLSERAIEKHSNSIFVKLGLSQEPDLNRRVSAVVMYLGTQRSA